MLTCTMICRMCLLRETSPTKFGRAWILNEGLTVNMSSTAPPSESMALAAVKLDRDRRLFALIRDSKSASECPSCMIPWSQNPSSRITMSPDAYCGHTSCRSCYFKYLDTAHKKYGSCMVCRN